MSGNRSLILEGLAVSKERKIFDRDGYSFIKESGLSWIKKHSENGFFSVSAYRASADKETNVKNNKEMNAMVRDVGLGFITLAGGYYEDGVGGEDSVYVEEISIFVPYKNTISEEDFIDLVTRICVKYNQDGFLIMLSGWDSVELRERTGNGKSYSKRYKKGKFKVDNMAKYYSQLKKGGSDTEIKYTFEGYKVPNNSIEGMCLEKNGEIMITVENLKNK